jgi:hypothetical protein
MAMFSRIQVSNHTRRGLRAWLMGFVMGKFREERMKWPAGPSSSLLVEWDGVDRAVGQLTLLVFS